MCRHRGRWGSDNFDHNLFDHNRTGPRPAKVRFGQGFDQLCIESFVPDRFGIGATGERFEWLRRQP